MEMMGPTIANEVGPILSHTIGDFRVIICVHLGAVQFQKCFKNCLNTASWEM